MDIDHDRITLPVVGDPRTADIEVVVFAPSEPEADVSFFVRCLCAACQEIDHAGIRESMGGWADKPGVYYMQAWSEVYPSGPWGGEEYDGGIRIAEQGDDQT